MTQPETCKDKENSQADPEEVQHCQGDFQKSHLEAQPGNIRDKHSWTSITQLERGIETSIAKTSIKSKPAQSQIWKW